MNNEAMQMIALRRALKVLDSVGAEYAVRFGGQTYGDLPTGGRNVPHGAIRQRIREVLADVKPGESRCISLDGADLFQLRNNTTAFCNKMWGPGATVVRSNPDDDDSVSVLRII